MKKGKILAGFFGFIITIIVAVFPDDIRTAIVGENKKENPKENKKKKIVKPNDSIINIQTSEKETEVIREKKEDSEPKTPPINIIAVNHSNQTGIKEIAIVLKNEKNQYSNLSSSIADLYNQRSNTQGISNLFNSTFLTKYFDPIYSGNSSNKLNQDIYKYVDALLIGEISFSESINDRDMHTIRVKFDANLYDVKDFRLIKKVTATSKGLNFEKSLAKEQAVEELIEKLKKEI